MHVVVRQNFVPRISLYAKFEVVVPDFARNALLHEGRRHMVVEFLTTRDCMLQRGEKPARSFEDFGDWIDESLVVTRLMLRDRRSDRGHDVRGATLFRKENLNARACGLCRLDKDKIVLVRNDHRPFRRRLETQRNLLDDW